MSNKTIKGKRPEFYETPGVDELMHMVMVLSQELCATRDRLDTLERVAESKAVLSQDDIEHHELDQAALEQREQRRQVMFGNLFAFAAQRSTEAASGDSKERFHSVIEDLATTG